MKEAYYYDKIESNKVKCYLCPHQCLLNESDKGICKVRENQEGILYSLNYGEISAIQIDPIEKKPLKEFMPGTQVYSIGSYGCNFHCDFCQNHSIALNRPDTYLLTPEDIVEGAIKAGTPSIAYTYNEPTIFFEFMFDCARLAKKKGLKNIVVTNGFINEKPLKDILPYIDAFNIDLKGYDDKKYKKICGGTSLDVLKTIQIASQSSHVEVTMLIVPGINDDLKKMEELFKKLKKESPHIVLHLSRYFPNYKMKDAATSISLLLELQKLALQYFDKVYLGNV